MYGTYTKVLTEQTKPVVPKLFRLEGPLMYRLFSAAPFVQIKTGPLQYHARIYFKQ